MRHKLISTTDVRSALAHTEPLESFHVDSDTRFRLGAWNIDSSTTSEPTDIVDAEVEISGQSFPLTKEALLAATSSIGLKTSYVQKTPAYLIEPQLNYWIEQSVKDQKLLVSNGTASAFTRSTITPFSNVTLLNSILTALGDQEVLVDYKFNHSLTDTSIRLVLPQRSRVLERTGKLDDEWSVGIQLTNSATGARQTSIEGYLFRWWCTNGAITKHNLGTWSRKSNGQGDEVYDWARQAVDEVLGGMEMALDEIQGLVDIPVDGIAADILKDIFSTYNIHREEREAITANMVEAVNLNMYEVMNAVTSVANTPGLSPARVEQLLAAGGDIPHTIVSRCTSCNQKLG